MLIDMIIYLIVKNTNFIQLQLCGSQVSILTSLEGIEPLTSLVIGCLHTHQFLDHPNTILKLVTNNVIVHEYKHVYFNFPHFYKINFLKMSLIYAFYVVMILMTLCYGILLFQFHYEIKFILNMWAINSDTIMLMV